MNYVYSGEKRIFPDLFSFFKATFNAQDTFYETGEY